MQRDRLLSMMGLATKAGKVKSGEFSVEKSIKEGKAFLVIVAEDASDNTKKNFTDMCNFYKTRIIFHGNKESLGNAIGKQHRACVALLDEGFAKSILKLKEDIWQE